VKSQNWNANDVTNNRNKPPGIGSWTKSTLLNTASD